MFGGGMCLYGYGDDWYYWLSCFGRWCSGDYWWLLVYGRISVGFGNYFLWSDDMYECLYVLCVYWGVIFYIYNYGKGYIKRF